MKKKGEWMKDISIGELVVQIIEKWDIKPDNG